MATEFIIRNKKELAKNALTGAIYRGNHIPYFVKVNPDHYVITICIEEPYADCESVLTINPLLLPHQEFYQVQDRTP